MGEMGHPGRPGHLGLSRMSRPSRPSRVASFAGGVLVGHGHPPLPVLHGQYRAGASRGFRLKNLGFD